IVKGKLSSKSGKRKGCYEIYDHSRYFTFTGDKIDAKYSYIKERQNVVEELYLSLNGLSEKSKAVIPFPEGDKFNDKETEEIINKAKSAKNSEKFSILFGGQWHELDYPSQSEADQALCSQIAFYTNKPYVIDQVFRRSGLFRNKWERQDYREGTITNAIALKHQQIQNDFHQKLSDNGTVPVLSDRIHN
ncbi:MAG: DNA primase, partial [Deltaproteobacteria bacterium]|nr:DNA primase [Deltaproteobacteria bacterium]